MQNGNQIITILLLVIAAIFALFIGSAIGSDDQSTPAIFISIGIAIALAVKLGGNVWILLPVLWMWTGQINVLPLPFSVRNLATFFVLGVLAISAATGKGKFLNKMGFLDGVILLLACLIGVVFLLNPVGLASIASENVGARPYFEIGMALLAYLALANQSMTASQSRLFPKLVVLSAFVLCIGKVIALKTPYGFTLWYFYTDWAPEMSGTYSAAAEMLDVGRVSLYTEVSGAVLLYLFASGNPFSVLNPLRFPRFVTFLLALAGIFVSGFRSLLFLYGTAFVAATFIWMRFKGVILGVALAIVGLVLLIALNEIAPLPRSMQRSLSFLPGNWDEIAKRDAAGSSEWRFEMWEQALFTDEVIKNKILGDGFGFSSREIALLRSAQVGGSSGEYYDTMHEHMLLIGGFHSGPISTVRYVGYVGLFIYLVLIIGMAVMTYRTIQAAKGTPYFMAAMFFGLTWIFYPVFFVAIFGGFEGDFPKFLLGAGMLKLMRNSLRAYRAEHEPAVVPVRAEAPETAPALAPTKG